MHGPSNTDRMPVLAHARVEGYDPATYSVYVTVPSMQEIYLPIKILINGPADATRVEQMPMPVMGTWGLVAFPYGTIESAIWLGSFYHSPVNAVTTSNPPTQQDSQIKYMSHASGSWSMLDYIGQYFYRAADGSNVIMNSNNTEPIAYIHSVNDEGVQTLQEFYDQDRNTAKPPPFYLSVNHPSGSSFTISPDGTITILEGNISEAQIDLTPDGTILIQGGIYSKASIQITPDGIITAQTGTTDDGANVGPTMTMDPQQGLVLVKGENNKSSIAMDANGQITASADSGNGVITMDSSGNITINSTPGNITIEAGVSVLISATDLVNVSGSFAVAIETDNDIALSTGAHPVESVNTMITIYNEHVHIYEEDGSAAFTSPPIPQMP